MPTTYSLLLLAAGVLLALAMLYLAFLFFRTTFLTINRLLLRKDRKAHGRCPNCDYDLQGHPIPCPKCGQVPQPPPPEP